MKARRNPRCRTPGRARGFTLLELMLAITLAAIVLGFGVPSFQNFVRNSRITGVANELLSAVYLARSEAVKRRASTVLCLSSNPDDAAPACDGDGSQGWVVFVDDADPDVASGNDRNVQVDAGETVLLRHGPLHATVGVNVAPADNEGYVSFAPSGAARGIAAVGTPFSSLVLCDDRGNALVPGTDDDSTARALVVEPIGRPRVTRSQSEIAADLGGCP